MNRNEREVAFRQRGDEVDMWVERDCAPFDDYVCGVLRKDEQGFFRFHPRTGVMMHCKLLREVALEVSRLNTLDFIRSTEKETTTPSEIQHHPV